MNKLAGQRDTLRRKKLAGSVLPPPGHRPSGVVGYYRLHPPKIDTNEFPIAMIKFK